MKPPRLQSRALLYTSHVLARLLYSREIVPGESSRSEEKKKKKN